MTRNIFFLFSLISLLGLQSCFWPGPKEIKLPPHQTKLSVISQVIPNRIMFVQVSKTFSALTPQEDALAQDTNFLASLLVEHARVTVSFAGETHELQHIGFGVYASLDILQIENEMYTLHVKDSATELECTAMSRMLPRIDINRDSVKVIYQATPDDTSIFVKYAIDDPPGPNYYLVDYVRFDGDTNRPRNPFNFGTVENKFVLLTDKEFSNSHYSGRIGVNQEPGTQILFSVTNISEEYYKYLTTFKKTGSLFNQLTGEPIGFPTNVSNGYGFFTTHNPYLITLDL